MPGSSETTPEAAAAFLREAIRLATDSAASGGGPFGAIVVRGGVVIARGVNAVTARHDPTAHAEIQAIRAACAALESFQLEGCEIFSSSEPCPMCLGALYWARPAAIWYASTHLDAARAGFDDRFIYDEMALSPGDRSLPMRQLPVPGAGDEFAAWVENSGRTEY